MAHVPSIYTKHMQISGNPLTKWVWTDTDFAEMGWHDTTIHAIASITETFELLFDIDYILQWIAPTPPETTFSFWVAPATLVFTHVWEMDAHIQSWNGAFVIDAIHRGEPQVTPNQMMTSWVWRIEGTEGRIQFRACGYTQYVRTQPHFGFTQKLSYRQRNGISFARIQENDTMI